jgi:hypothetical protein
MIVVLNAGGRRDAPGSNRASFHNISTGVDQESLAGSPAGWFDNARIRFSLTFQND